MGPRYDVAWWDCTKGADGAIRQAGMIAGGPQRLTAPTDSDWALRINMIATR
jgi:hypothetical protein